MTDAMKVDFIDILLFVLFFQLISIGPILLFQKKPGSRANQILGFFLLTKALCITHFIAMRLYPYTLRVFPHAFYFGTSFTILWGPSLYFYAKAMTYRNFRFRGRDMLHFIPPLVHFFYLLLRFHLHSAATKRTLMGSGLVMSSQLWDIYNVYLFASILIYTLFAIRLVLIYRNQIKNALSSIEKQQLSWLMTVLAGFFTKWILDTWYMTEHYITGEWAQAPLIASRIVLFIFLNMLIVKAMRQPQLFTGIETKRDTKKFSLSKAVADRYVKQLMEYMEKNKPYYNPDMTLYDLAEAVSIPPRSLSEVINGILGQNFYDFVNSYRIKESQKILSESAPRRKTVLEVLYEVGFNSKSVFNDAFKKYTGMTPTEFKRQYQE
ncbi:helix-turn-helix domain-containing protein [bacterium]|nr:helix-turn-helix domain-containing protein [bacterium]